MAVVPAILSLFLYLNVVSGYVLMSDEGNEIVWPSEYHFNGEIFNFETTLKETFEIWYSSEFNRSRIDYYGGSSKTYYYTYYTYTILPTATSDMSVENRCVKTHTKEEDNAGFLPDVSALTYTGQTVNLFDKVVDVWKGTETSEDGGSITEETLYVFKTDYVHIPVQYESKTLNMERGTVDSHIIKNYYNFHDSVSKEDVSVADVRKCEYGGELGKDLKKDMMMLHPYVPQEVDKLFESFVSHHGKKYHEKERQTRKRIFEKNWRIVHKHNHKNLGFRLELNAFSDRTPEELRHLTGTLPSNNTSTSALPFPHTLEEIDNIAAELPENLDLRMEGLVSPVKNQGDCGSCWAFATAAALEGALAKVNGDRVMDLSEQSLVDCSWRLVNVEEARGVCQDGSKWRSVRSAYSNGRAAYKCLGCHGGFLDHAWTYVLEHGVPTDREYGLYLDHDGYCNIQNMSTVYQIKGFALVTPLNANALKVALNKYGPVTVTIFASETMMQYSSGIFYDLSCEGKSLNHAVTVVGYGVRDGEDYWLVKNSWGEDWGEDGYILMSAKNNNCLLLDGPYYPIV